MDNDFDDETQHRRAKIKELRDQGELSKAYQYSIESLNNDFDVRLELAWVMYDLLKQETNKKTIAPFLKVLRQCDRLQLFDAQNGYFFLVFWRNVQLRVANKAWTLAKQNNMTDLRHLLMTIDQSMANLSDVDYDNQPDDRVYRDSRTGQRGMAGMISSVLGALSTLANKQPLKEQLSLWQKLLAKVSSESIRQLIIERIRRHLISIAWQLCKENKAEQLRNYLQVILPLIKQLHFPLGELFLPFYFGLHSHQQGQFLAADKQVLIDLINATGIDTLTNIDYQKDSDKYSSTAAKIAQFVFHVGPEKFQLTPQFNQLLILEKKKQLIAEAWQMEKTNNLPGLWNTFTQTRQWLQQMSSTVEIEDATKWLMPYFVGFSAHHQEISSANNAAHLIAVIDFFGAYYFGNDAFTHQKKSPNEKWPSFAEKMVKVYLDTLMQLPTAQQHLPQIADQQLKSVWQTRALSWIANQEWNLYKKKQPHQLAAFFTKIQPLLTQINYQKQTRELLLPYYLGLYKDIKEYNSQDAATYTKIVTFFGFDHFQAADLKEKEAEDADYYLPSFAENIINSFIKSLLITGANAQQLTMAKHSLEVLTEQTQARDWIVYNLGKLLLKKGQITELDSELLSAVKRNQRNTFFWALLAKRYQQSAPDKYQACLEMAAALPNVQLDVIINLTRLFTNLPDQRRIVKSLLIFAKQIQGHRSLPNDLLQLQNQDWYQSITPVEDLSHTLQALAKTKLGEILYADKPLLKFFVSWQDSKRNATKIIPIDEHGFRIEPLMIHDETLFSQTTTGKFYQAKIITNGKYHEFYGELQPIDVKEFHNNFVRPFRQHFDKRAEQDYGFIHLPELKYRVPEQVVNKYHLHNYDLIEGELWTNWNRKKETWGWEIGKITKVKHIENKHNLVTGTLDLNKNRTFALIVLPNGNNVFVPEKLLKGTSYDDHENVQAVTEFSWDQRRKHWGQRAIEITSTDKH